MSDPRRLDARSRLRAVPSRGDTSPEGRASLPSDRTQSPTRLSEHGNPGPVPFRGFLAFGVIAWGLGIILAVSDTGGQFSKASAIGVLLLLGCVAFLVGLGLVAHRVRPVAAPVIIEADIRDPLTGLPNQRYLLLRLEEEMALARRHERPLTLAILDVNSLAAVNEQYGRDCGDEVLRHVAAAAQDTKRASDALARLNDDEFAVILPDCNSQGGQAFVGRLTERLARQPLSTALNNRASHVWVGVCVGLAATQSEQDTPASLLDRARAELTCSREERDRRRQRWQTA